MPVPVPVPDRETSLELVIVFTRFPVAGVTKTRLIPVLGAGGAAELQRAMTEHTMRALAGVRELAPEPFVTSPARGAEIEVRHEGGEAEAMRRWLGNGLRYAPQGGGDLGERMARAFDDAFEAGRERVVVVGTDCPELDAGGVGRALDELRRRDLVLGPAADGGYYLIGLSRPEPELFRGVAWGTETVFRRTVEIAGALGLSMARLEELADVDRPEDLPVWERAAGSSRVDLQACKLEYSIVSPK